MKRSTMPDKGHRHRGAGAAFLLTVTVSLSALIAWNALIGQAGQGPGTLLARDVPAGASTHVEVVAKTDGQTTITLRYDPQVEAVQRALKQAGYYTGTVDGVEGARTREAVLAWQRATGAAETGTIDGALLDHIRFTQQVAAAAQATNSITPPEPASATPDNAARLTETARIMKVQADLAALGYEVGEPDGTLSADTRAAILKFEMDRGLAMDGAVSEALLAELARPAAAAP